MACALLASVVTACAGRPTGGASAGTDTGATASSGTTESGESAPDDSGTTGAPSSESTATGSDPGATASTDIGSSEGSDTTGETCGEDSGGTVEEGESCEPGAGECRLGLKCFPYGPHGNCAPHRDKCVPILGCQGAGDPCERFEDGDDCAPGLFCFRDGCAAEPGPGACVELCNASDPDACETGEICVPWNDGAMPMCNAPCDPLSPDCPAGTECYGTSQLFVCWPLPEDDGGDDGAACVAINSCRPGFVCVTPAATAGCQDDFGCCTPLCDVTGPPSQCPEPSEECVAWFEEGQAPDGLENVGYCGVP